MLDSLKQLASTALTHLHTRASLFELELEEEKSRLIAVGVSLGLAFFFCMMAVVTSAVGVIAYFWDSIYRMHAVWSLAGFFVAGMIVSFVVLRAKLKTRSVLFKGSLAELKKDRDVLERLNEAA